jgi:hypothetical protein
MEVKTSRIYILHCGFATLNRTGHECGSSIFHVPNLYLGGMNFNEESLVENRNSCPARLAWVSSSLLSTRYYPKIDLCPSRPEDTVEQRCVPSGVQP